MNSTRISNLVFNILLVLAFFMSLPASATPAIAHASMSVLAESWATSQIIPTAFGSTPIALGVDAAEIMHTAYFNDGNFNGLHHAWFDGMAWQDEMVDNVTGNSIDLAIGSDNQMYVLYDNGDQTLKLAAFDGSSWATEVVTETVPYEQKGYGAIALDDNGALHVSFYNRVNQSLYYGVRKEGEKWMFSMVQSNAGMHTDIAIDNQGNPHISYCGVNDICYGLRHAEFDGSDWTITNLTTASGAGQYTQIAFTPEGFPVIAAYEETNQALKLFRKNTGGTWETIPVASSTGGGNPLGLAVDISGVAHLAYRVSSSGDLWYARYDGLLSSEAASLEGDVGASAALALDLAGKPLIAHQASDYSLLLTGIGLGVDLQITDIWKEGIYLSFQALNAGQAPVPAGHVARITVDGMQIGTHTFSAALAPGERLTVNTTLGHTCMAPSDTITVQADYTNLVAETDEANNSRIEVWNCDTLPPVITTGPTVSALTATSATITWTTNEASDSYVGINTRRGAALNWASSSTAVTSHSVTLTGLSPNTTYEAVARSTDHVGNEVLSKPFQFTTPSGTITKPNPKSNTVTRTTRSYESYALVSEVTNPTNVAHMDFYMDGVLIGTDYTPNNLGQFEYEFVPGLTGMNRGEWFGTAHQMNSTAVLVDGTNVQQFSTFNPLNEPMEINLLFSQPTSGHVLYTPDNTMPAGSSLPVEVLAEEFGWHCSVHGGGTADPDSSPLPCGDQAAPVEKLELFLDDALKGSFLYPANTVFNVSVSVAGLGTGRHTLKATATASDGTNKSVYSYVDIVKSDSPPQVSHVGYISGSFVVVQVKITNPSNSLYPIEVNKIYETAHGLQWLPQAMNYGSISGKYIPATRNSWITLTRSSLKTISPGQSMMIEYRLSPILYEDMPNVTYWLNKEAMTVVDYTIQGINRIVGVPSELAVLTTPQGLATFNNAVQQSMQDADYLIVTNPSQLFLHHDDAKVETLLSKMAELAVAKQGVLGYLDTFDDGSVLNNLISLGSPWFSRLNEAFAGSVDAYLLLVGDLRIIASDRSMSLYMPNINADDYQRVHHTDNMYAFVSGDGRPDLVVGRLIGSVDTMITTLQTSLDVFNKTGGRVFNKLETSFVSGSEPHEYLFEKNVRNLRDTAADYGHVHNEVYFDYQSALWYYNFNFEQFDGVAGCDLDGNGDDELVIGDRSSNQLRFISPADGALLGSIALTFDEGDGLACGDVDDDGYDEIIHGDRDDKIYLFDYHTGFFNQFSKEFMAYDQLAVGDVLSANPGDEIVMADRHDYIYVFNMNGSVLITINLGALSPAIDFIEGDKLAVGNIFDGVGLDEIVIASREDDKFYFFGATGALLGSYPQDFEYGEDIAIGDAITPTGGAEELVFANRDNTITAFRFVYNGSGFEPSTQSSHSDFEQNDRIVLAKVAPSDTRQTIIEFMRADQISAIDIDFPDHGLDLLYNNMATITADLLMYRGHGNNNTWSDVMNYNQVRDFGSLAPVVAALTCLSGDYPNLEDTNMAASVLKYGAGLYIGATETSVADFNDEASTMFLTRFFSLRPAGADWTHLERKLWGTSGSQDYYYYFVYEYNLYGDPKFGNLLPTLDTGASSIQEITMPEASLVVDIPNYDHQELDGYSYFSLPDNVVYTVDGQPVVPLYLATIDYPAGTLVQDVVLTGRVLSETLEGVTMPLFDINAIDGFQAASQASGLLAAVSTTEDGWMPVLEQPFTWQVTEHSDGSSTLEILIYPMEYSPATLRARFYNQFTFEIATASTTTAITSLVATQLNFAPESPVTFDMVISTTGGPQDLTVVAEIRRSRSTDPAGSIPFDQIKGLNGKGRYTMTWDSSGVETGLYFLEVSLYNNSQLVAQKFIEFQIGQVKLEVQDLQAGANRFTTGQNVTFTFDVANTGDEAAEGSVYLLVNGPDGYTATLKQDLNSLNAGTSQPFTFIWNTGGVPNGVFTASAYVSYESQASPALLVALANHFKLFLPMQEK